MCIVTLAIVQRLCTVEMSLSKSDKEREEHSRPTSESWVSNRTYLYEIGRNRTWNYEVSEVFGTTMERTSDHRECKHYNKIGANKTRFAVVTKH